MVNHEKLAKWSMYHKKENDIKKFYDKKTNNKILFEQPSVIDYNLVGFLKLWIYSNNLIYELFYANKLKIDSSFNKFLKSRKSSFTLEK